MNCLCLMKLKLFHKAKFFISNQRQTDNSCHIGLFFHGENPKSNNFLEYFLLYILFYAGLTLLLKEMMIDKVKLIDEIRLYMARTEPRNIRVFELNVLNVLQKK